MRKNEFDNLTHKIPYFAYHNGVGALTDGTLFTGLRLEGLDSLAMTSEFLSQCKSRFKSVFENLPAGCSVQFFYDYHADNHELLQKLETRLKSTNSISQQIKDSYLGKLNHDSSLRNAALYVFIIFPRKTLANANNAVFSRFETCYQWFKKTIKRQSPEQRLAYTFADKSEELRQSLDNITVGFRDVMGINVAAIDRSKLFGLIYKILNPDKSLPTGKRSKRGSHDNYFQDFLTMREALVHTNVEEHSDRIQLGERHMTVLTLKLPSRFTQIFDADIILNSIDFPFYWSFNFTILNTPGKNAELEAKQRRKHAFVASSDNPNVNSSVSKSEIEQALVDQKTEGFNWYDFSMSFMVYANTESELKTRSTKLISIFRDFQESILVEEKYAQLNYLIASLPGCGHLNDRKFLFTSSNVSDLVPLSVPPSGTKDLSCLFNTHRNTLFQFSIFTDEFNNWNQVVVGKIGSGKSFIVNNILSLSLMSMAKPKVMILDLGQSFKRTTELWGGKYITIDLDQPDSGLNPLPPANSIREGGEDALGILDFTVQLLLLMTGFGPEHKLHARVVRKALAETYRRLGKHDPILSDLHATLKNSDVVFDDVVDTDLARTMAKLLEDYIGDGPYAKLFNRHSNFDVNSDFFCFDFKHAGQNRHLREIATYVVGGYICRKMVADAEPKFIIFDEFATTMQHETGAALCRMIAKNCRKHGTSFICISQEIEDFLHNPAAQTVYHQSNYKWFLRLDDDLAKYKEHLRLTDTDIEIISALTTRKGEFAEVYLNYGDKKAQLSLKPDPLTYWICTTDAKDKVMLQAYLDYVARSSTEALVSVSDQRIKEIFSSNSALFKGNPLIFILRVMSERYPAGVNSPDLENDAIYLERHSTSVKNSTKNIIQDTEVN